MSDQQTAATTTDGATQSTETVAASTLLGATEAATTTALDTQAVTQTAEGDKPAAEGDKPAVVGAPEKYEFTAPEGEKYDPAVIDAFSAVAKELNLTQDNAQKVLDKMSPVLAARQAETLAHARDTWAAEVKSDKEIGGTKLDENLAFGRKVLDQFGTPELKKLLNESALGNHPEVVRFFVKAGKAISDDRIVTGQSGDQQRKNPVDVLYNNQ